MKCGELRSCSQYTATRIDPQRDARSGVQFKVQLVPEGPRRVASDKQRVHHTGRGVSSLVH
jgi:hypothetical protein